MALGISSGLFSKSGGNILISPKKKIRITGFPLNDNSDWIQAYTQLAAAINKLALTSKYIKINPEPIENEKYSFRVCLVFSIFCLLIS